MYFLLKFSHQFQILNLKHIQEKEIRARPREENIPYTELNSIANGFSFFPSYSSVLPDNDRLVGRIKEKEIMENAFIDDLKFLLRLYLSAYI